MNQAELLVGLKIPDTTAITAFHTLERMGFSTVKSLERMDYFLFSFDGDFDVFKEKIMKVDILVNANKHIPRVKRKDEKLRHDSDEVFVLVKERMQDNSLMNVLQNRLGLDEIREAERGTLWRIVFSDGKNKETAKKIAQELLANINYQSFEIF